MIIAKVTPAGKNQTLEYVLKTVNISPMRNAISHIAARRMATAISPTILSAMLRFAIWSARA
ncbi:hypothetical protein [Devosia soli]|uniref:hypothetical protein n=1 Tax=Devosia soli TaxID=361041 RepID=UPI001FCE1CEA|nr:hypothetical protein [Devosia soli]